MFETFCVYQIWLNLINPNSTTNNWIWTNGSTPFFDLWMDGQPKLQNGNCSFADIFGQAWWSDSCFSTHNFCCQLRLGNFLNKCLL